MPILYSRLNQARREVRFLEILPSDTPGDQQVCCRLETASLLDNTPYAALSYVWGDPNITEDILVNGITLSVTTNLASALRQFRKTGFPPHKKIGKLDKLSSHLSRKFGLPQNQKTGKSQKLWADAICINQKDIEEKNYQVPLMGEIYGNASTILSWLGAPNDDRLDSTLVAIRSIAADIHSSPDSDIDLYTKEAYNAFSRLINILDYDAAGLAQGGRLFKVLRENMYWKRMWILQEIALSKSPLTHWFICGDESITFAELDKYHCLIDFLSERPFPPEYGLTETQNMCLEILSETPEFNLRTFRVAKFLSTARHTHIGLFEASCKAGLDCSASNPRDMVYGILGMFPNASIKAEYRRPVKEIYIEALSVTHNKDKAEHCLEYSGCGLNANNEYNLPTWLPDLSKVAWNGHMPSDIRMDSRPLLDTTGFSQPEIIGGDTLCVQGVVCSSVELIKRLVFDPDTDKVPYQFWVDYLAGFCDEFMAKLQAHLLDLDEVLGNEIRPLKALMDVLDWQMQDYREVHSRYGYPGLELPSIYWDLLAQLQHIDDTSTRAEQEDAFKRLGLPHDPSLSRVMAICFTSLKDVAIDQENMDSSSPKQASSMINFKNFIASINGQTLFKTSNGQLGIGPPYMEQGDLVCVVHQRTLPTLLRRAGTVDGDSSFFKHVGTCYVLGLSDGEPAEMVANGESNVQMFKIR